MTISRAIRSSSPIPFVIACAAVALAGFIAPGLAEAQPQCVATVNVPVGQQFFVVPAGVTTISVDAFGGQGGSVPAGLNGGTGGLGGRATIAGLTVTPGESLNVIAGAQGGSIPGPQNSTPAPGAPGGPLDGGPGGASVPAAAHPGAGGGGASGIVRGIIRLLVAGGGGGASHGGNGGAGGQNGANGQKQSPAGTSVPGGGAIGGAGGSAGTGSGNGGNGTGGDPSGQGGTGGIGGDGGGGGGGGWAGGGGGGGGTGTGDGGGTGGGGGSSFGPAGTTFQTGVRTGGGQVTISYVDPACQPAITLVKSRVGTGPVTVGSTVTYNFLVTNNGNTDLTSVVVTDPLPGLSPIACPATVLAAGASMTCTATYVATEADRTNGAINNTAMVTGQPPAGLPPVTAVDSETVPVVAPAQPAITLAKSVSSTGPYPVGATVAYAFLVTNTGNVELTNVVVTDPLPGLSPIACPATTLAAGASMTCTAAYVVTQADINNGAINNSATTTGQPPPGSPPPTGGDTERVVVPGDVGQPGIALAKSRIGTGPVTVGSTVNYAFLVTNTGNVELTNVVVTDPLPGLSPVSCPATTLAAGANMTCTATYVATQADVDAGAIDNTATATGQPPGGLPPPTASDTERVIVPGPVPSLPEVMTVLLAVLLLATAMWTLRRRTVLGE